MDKIRVGDVLVNRAGTMRVVRNVSKWNGKFQCVTFSIMRCSWTTRCYTVLNAHDLDYQGYRRIGKRVKLTKKIDKLIDYCIKNHDRKDQKLDCCDVHGIT